MAEDQTGFVSTDTSKLNPLVRVKATPKIKYINNVEQKRQLGEKISDFELKRERQFRKDLNRKPETLTDKVGNFFNKVIGVQAAEGATLDNKPGIVTPSSYGVKDTKVASSMSGGSYGGYVDAGSRGFVSPEQAGKMLSNPEAYKMRPSETRYLRESMGLPRASLGGTDGSLIASVDPSKIRGISTPAAETKVTETKRLAGDRFGNDNYRMSQNPDPTQMTREQMKQSIFGDPGYSRFGTRDAEGTQAAKDTRAFNESYKRSFFTPDKVDARSIT